MMKHALIEGNRIAQIADQPFPVATPLRWVEVPDDTTARDGYVGSVVVKFLPPAPPLAPTDDEIYDAFVQQRVFRALILALNDGTFPVGTNKTGAQLKAIIKAKM